MSELLQEILREKKAEARRLSHNFAQHTANSAAMEGRESQSSPLAPPKTRVDKHRALRTASAVGSRSASMPKDMGVKEMEEVCPVVQPTR